MTTKEKKQLKREVLDWINEERAKKGTAPRRFIKKGTHWSESCPIANTLSNGYRARVGRNRWSWNGDYRSRKLPPQCVTFIYMFDKEAEFKELEL